MMDVEDPEILACMNNYQVHLIDPAQMSDDEIMKFQSSLREVLFFIKYSKDKERLSRMVQETDAQRFQMLERRAADVIQAITNIEIKYDEEQEVVDMCQAIKEMIEDGRKEGFENGRKEGFENGEFKKAQESARNFYHLGVEIEKVAQGVGYSVETVRDWLGLE